MRAVSITFACCSMLSAQSGAWEAAHTEAAAAIESGKWQQAGPLLETTLKEAQKFPLTDSRILTSLKDLADFHQMQGRPADSERFLSRMVEIRERVDGPEHDDTARARLDLARNLLLQSKLGEAEAALKRALATLEKNHGAKAVELLPPAALGVQIYQAKPDWIQAEVLLLRALSIRESTNGAESYELAPDLIALGEFYVRRMRWAIAEPRFRRALAITETRFGPEHVSQAPMLDKLAIICREMQRAPEAEAILRRALMLRERVYGSMHHEVAGTLDALGGLVYAEKRYEEAERIYARSLAIWTAVLGADHPAVAGGIDNLAVAQASQNKYAEAFDNYGKALAIREAEVVRSVYSMARVLESSGKPADAEALYTANKRLIDRLPASSEMLPVVLEHYAAVLRKTSKHAAAARIEAQSKLLARKKQKDKVAEP